MQLATHDDAALGEADLLANLVVQIPAGGGDGRRDVLGTDVTLEEVFFVGY